jgi:hypothetical protein
VALDITNMRAQKKYIIYHIRGVKIGCTSKIKRRMEQQGNPEYEVLEIHTDIEEASKRERELQEQYGYRVDTCDYKTSVDNRYKFPDELQKELNKRVKNRYVWSSEEAKAAAKKGSEKAWTEYRDTMLEKARENVKAATEAAAKSPNRASLQPYYCIECDREIIGAGPAGIHRKVHKHNVNKKI